ncbi:TPA: type II and III secretion system protein, partial [Vibrio parahaemolyticus]|nr:type II and III secretion system protein [Vibrio parahaemolyticus]
MKLNTMKPHLLFVPLAMMLLNGCVSQDYLDHKANADQVQKQMEDARSNNATPLGNVQYLTKPPALATPIKQDKAPKWLQQEVRIKANQLPLSLVLSMLVQGTNVEVSFDPDVNPNTPITVNTRASRKSILNLISSLTHYGLTPDQDSLTVGYYQTETFVLTIPSGANSAQQGSQSEESSSDDEGDTSTTKVDGQYITTVYNNTEITTEISKAVEAVLKDESEDDGEELVGDVRVVPGLTAITVRTTPSRMAQVRRL